MPHLIQLNLLVLLWSFTAILAEFIQLQTPSIVLWRTAIASLAFYFISRAQRDKSGQFTPPTRRQIGMAWLTGAILGLHWLCFFGAIVTANVSIGLAGFAATALFTALLQPVFEKKAPTRNEILLALLVAVGLIIIASARTTVPNALLGLAIALLGALLAAAYGLASKQLVEARLSGPVMMAHQIPVSGLVSALAIAVVPGWRFEVPALPDLAPLLCLALLCTTIAYLWYAALLKHLSAYTVSLAMNFEPVYGMLLAALILQEHETLGPRFYLGTLAIVIANLVHARLEKKPQPAPA
ncbi:MAG: DMT family transporter [Verrucomicrobiota bacterium JB023]|nr:DMT family transporter [Verrucomicrobiota bacterium JB023]